MKVDAKKRQINAEEMECLVLKYMKKHDVERREAMRMVCNNGFNNTTIK